MMIVNEMTKELKINTVLHEHNTVKQNNVVDKILFQCWSSPNVM